MLLWIQEGGEMSQLSQEMEGKLGQTHEHTQTFFQQESPVSSNRALSWDFKHNSFLGKICTRIPQCNSSGEMRERVREWRLSTGRSEVMRPSRIWNVVKFKMLILNLIKVWMSTLFKPCIWQIYAVGTWEATAWEMEGRREGGVGGIEGGRRDSGKEWWDATIWKVRHGTCGYVSVCVCGGRMAAWLTTWIMALYIENTKQK